ncbi:cyclopropane-fatty-acyl-phospholipid synthase [Chryseotalea sanaruensis]|uniref:Cyclopropane-fatty-acyl-phospholipid synthase n=1 Tax=Chryseotalea sanaruensis TaxID=2482724 RepID=A0A401U653_9BACT|nr:cyclopropane fatty acyl phospholipid synthase [Chryseotalea sanaruensis]GCC50408.1 cyclopropane-fatty-acyl-phospholipid synthase [Chryseotalea sanaruensis]
MKKDIGFQDEVLDKIDVDSGQQQSASSYKRRVIELFEHAGITVNGKQDYDIQVKDERFYQRVLAQGSLGLGESFVDEWWDCNKLDVLFAKISQAKLNHYAPHNVKLWLASLEAKLFNFQLPETALDNASFHYNIGNDLFMAMLDKRLTYTCGYWKNALTLDEAQEAKLELTCQKLHLEKGMRVLDIGCGWGSFARYAAEKYAVNVTGITLSSEQVKLGQQLCSDLPITLELKDYRDIRDKYDRIVSLGMLEHVGSKNYNTYFQVVADCLEKDGLFLLHTIGNNISSPGTDPWLDKYIFPNSHIPALTEILPAFENYFVLEDLHNFGGDYDTTLLAWHKNVSKHYDGLRKNYTKRFFRIWKYYLLSCAGLFRARQLQLWQMVFTKGRPGVYLSVR